MAVILDDLLEPLGPIDPSFFPDTADDLAARLETYIDTAIAKVAAYEATLDAAYADRAVKAWALHLAFRALYLLKASGPASANLEGLGGSSTAKDQRDAFKALSEEYRLEYLVLLPEVPAHSGEVAESGSRPVKTVITW